MIILVSNSHIIPPENVFVVIFQIMLKIQLY